MQSEAVMQEAIKPKNEIAHRLIDHWDVELSKTDLVQEPYNHFYMNRSFPDDIYKLLVDSIPSDEFFRPFNLKKWSRPNGESTRDILPLTEQNIATFEPGIQQIWEQVKLAFESDRFKRVIFDKLKNDISLRLGISPEEAVNFKPYVRSTFIRDSEGYRIKPHPDGQPKLVTMLFYFPEDDSQLELGTSIYTEETGLKKLFGQKFKEIKRFPFKPNGSGAFVVNDLPERRSLHGREYVDCGNAVRNSIILTWMSEASTKEEDRAITQTHDLLN